MVKRVAPKRLAQQQLDDRGFFVYSSTFSKPLGVQPSRINRGCILVEPGTPIVLTEELSREEAVSIVESYGFHVSERCTHFYKAMAE